MTVNIHFDTGFLSSEEAAGLTAFLGAVQPSLLTAAALREQQRASNYPFPNMIEKQAIYNAGLTTQAADPANATVTELAMRAEAEAEVAAKKTTRSRKPKPEEVAAAADAKPAISTDPENRIDPQNPEDEAQDAADEAAETASEQPANRTITTEDVKAAIGKYVAKFQLPATQEDGPGIFKSVLGAPPAGEPYWKLSILPTDQESLAKCEKAWLDAAAKAERTKVS